MSADVKALRSYLVALGFDVNQSQFRQFQNALNEAEKLARKTVGGIAGDVLKWQTFITGAFVSVGAAIVGVMEHVSTADQEFRLFGERMFMNTNNAKRLKIALDALGQPLEAIAFDPELHARWAVLQRDQLAMQQQMGGTSFTENMRKIRDIRFEFTRFMVELQYFGMNFVNSIFKSLGLDSGGFLKTLRHLNKIFQEKIPEWSQKLGYYLAPILKDAWRILKDIYFIGMDVGTVFTNFIGLISGDESLTGAANFDKMARSIAKVVHWLGIALHYLTKFFGLIAGAGIGGTVGAGVGAVIGGFTGGPLGALAGAGTGGAIGTGVGAGVGSIFDLWRSTAGAEAGGGSTVSGGASAGGNLYRALAARVGASLGVPADIIYAQWAHETGGFTNRGATSLNNLAGIRYPGSTQYRSFGSLDDFGNYYSNLISRKYSSAMGAQSIDSYASALKRGGYFEDSLGNYEKGMKNRISGYGGTHITVGDIHVNQPNASPEQIKHAVKEGILEYQQDQTALQLSELRSIYG